ncbi:auxin-responsive protein SAUR24 [Cajanus cajan]|uniref:Auxin-induced protein X15 n=1 Tax=Cajanus cajan TaxID=3821 RepID=A0A151SG92_CAJCA|nr:auxin-responsive protein SAUR24 [Cajanus cajan]KYP53864.1 Auxin-induced protein X15 [Cajanus cajan]
MDSKKCNKIREVVRLQQILNKWKKVAAASASNNTKGIKFLKRTLSFTDSNDVVPKGFLAVCVGKELKRFTIPTHYLKHKAFQMLLRQAEEEFGFQQEGVLKFPCQVSVFEKILKAVQDNNGDKDNISYSELHHAQTCT